MSECEYQGAERRSVEQIQKVAIDHVENGAQLQLDEMLSLLRKVCIGIERSAKWVRRIGLFVAAGTISAIFMGGMWYMKVDTHVEMDEAKMVVQDELLLEVTSTQARTLGVLEGIDRRLTLLEQRAP
jgi:hypothetical protein